MTAPRPSTARPPTPTLRPTRLGTLFLVLVVLTLIGCVNYGLSLGYGLTFLLGGVWVIGAAQALRAVRGVRVGPPVPEHVPALAGRPLTFRVPLSREGRTLEAMQGGALRLRMRARQGEQTHPLSAAAPVSAAAGGLGLTLPAPRRGTLSLEAWRLSGLDPLGLWTADLPLTPDTGPGEVRLWVAPAAEAQPPAPPTLFAAGHAETGRRAAGQDDLAGLRPYQAGDAPRLVSWRHAARTGALLTREYDAPAGQAPALDWAATAGLPDPEARLSRLCAWVLAARAQGDAFSFSLPGTVLAAAAGEAQVAAALGALSAFGTPPTLPTLAPVRRTLLSPARREILPAGPLRFSLLALAVALLPGVLRQPVWLTALLAAGLGYAALRAGQDQGAAGPRRLPGVPAAALALVAVLGALGLNAVYGTLLGQDAGTALLGLLVVLKAAETHTRRDARLLSLLGLFLTSTHFFHDQGPLTALHALLATAALLAALGGWTLEDGEDRAADDAAPAPATGLRRAGQMMLLAAPLAGLLFALFPRPDGPLWQLPIQQGAQTGLADSISAGEFSNLAQSREVAFRADFTGTVPGPEERYWRGPVYELYDGLRWTQLRAFFNTAPIAVSGPTRSYSITLEPSGKPWLLALDSPVTQPRGTYFTSAFQAAAYPPPTRRTRYTFTQQAARLGLNEDERRLNLNLQLPPGQNPRALALAQGWRSLAPAQRVQAGLGVFRTGFSYSLNPPTLPEQNRIDAFLSSSRVGFCEHFASAFTFLMRAAGVPARIVGGYQGGEVNPDGGYLTVRQQDAHAWAEVWLAGQGWVRVDPTAVVAPARIRTDLGTALTQPQATAARPPGPLARALLRVDALQNSWNTWVAGYDGTQQRTLLARLGVGGVGSAPYLLALAALAVLAVLPGLMLARRAARPRDPLARSLHDLGTRLGLPQLPGETPTAYAARAGEQFPALAAELRAVAAEYNRLRYGRAGSDPAGVRGLRDRVRQVRRPR
ncbi:transglutaminaseTgpA domain-containing protein [Deinococcus sp. Leaf326]|uniref:transglutaminaseTgpA domain-containing protein n=1 Tax=Deinococcus sp. Leaf326 TaxID=1736338 RepID=UPI0006F3DFFF|nr:transglutaminaseTgpA domain-containing protein [Deinococcus sp. Leaf326]KQR36239.1 transglutaminase [Deinococcus sp. Leaf326]